MNAKGREKFRNLEKEKSINKELKEYKSRSSGFSCCNISHIASA